MNVCVNLFNVYEEFRYIFATMFRFLHMNSMQNTLYSHRLFFTRLSGTILLGILFSVPLSKMEEKVEKTRSNVKFVWNAFKLNCLYLWLWKKRIEKWQNKVNISVEAKIYMRTELSFLSNEVQIIHFTGWIGDTNLSKRRSSLGSKNPERPLRAVTIIR